MPSFPLRARRKIGVACVTDPLIMALPLDRVGMEHEVEIPGVVSSKTFALHWADGTAIPGVAFARASHVRVTVGAFTDECGSVRDLVCVEPEPCYRVELDASRVSLEVAQSSLDRL